MAKGCHRGQIMRDVQHCNAQLAIELLNKIEERQELFNSKNIIVTLEARQFDLYFHHHLAEILISNLLNNAIRYTVQGGSINIQLDTNVLSISNAAINGPLNTNRVFQRFYKASDSDFGTGLGLSIIKEICTTAGFSIQYLFEKDQHHFIIHFQA